MIRALLLTCLAGLVAAQYGHSGSGYGPDGVRNRYFILGHGRPITTSIGSGIYGSSVGSGSYRPSGGSGYGSSAPSRHSGYSSGSSGHSGAYGASNLGGYGGHGLSYASAAPAYAPAAPAYEPVQSYAPAPRAYAPAPQSYAPAVRSYSAPAASSYSAPSRSYGGHDDYAQPTPYDFGYDVHNEHGDQQSRQETGDGYGNVKGSYGYRDSYGIFRHVDYVADKDGFRANVRTNEPGTAPQDPADVKMQVEHGGYGNGY